MICPALSIPRCTAVLVAAVLAATGGVPVASASAGGQEAADYIVVLEDSGARPSDVAVAHRRRHGAQVTETYGSALQGYAARLTPAGRAGVLRDPRVAYVERDGVATLSTTQDSATWGLDRIDARTGLNTKFSYSSTGSGVTAYIIDTGVDSGHTEFSGRLAPGYNAFIDGWDDCNGHGTHVAGTVGGTTSGVAKRVTLVPVRVLDCFGSGSYSHIIAGIDWIVRQHAAGAPAVANLSLGGGASTAVDDAVKRLIADGVTTAVAAGNSGRDACTSSPARVPEAITIGATTRTDAKASWSNYGRCVDWFAPGVGITSAWIGLGSTERKTLDGTSMASPHTAGVAALFLQGKSGAEATAPAAVRRALHAATTKYVVRSSKTANNHLLYTAY